MRREVGEETTKKEMDNRRIFMTLHMTLFTVPVVSNATAYLWLCDCFGDEGEPSDMLLHLPF